MSNHKGGGMASKERLYELWMLYYTKVSASAEDLTLTPVVAAESPPPAWSFWHEPIKHMMADGVIGLCRLFWTVWMWGSRLVVCLYSGLAVLFTKWRSPRARISYDRATEPSKLLKQKILNQAD